MALYDSAKARIRGNWFRFNTSAIIIADRSKASVSANVLFKNIAAVSSLDSTRPQIHGNYRAANQTGIRLGQRAAPEIEGNWSLFEKKRVIDERDQPSKPLKKQNCPGGLIKSRQCRGIILIASQMWHNSFSSGKEELPVKYRNGRLHGLAFADIRVIPSGLN